MQHRPLAEELPAIPSTAEIVFRSASPSDQTALHRLTRAFHETRPMAVMVGEDLARSARVIELFLTDFDADTCVIRVPPETADAKACMQAVIRSIGFESKDFSLADLEKILMMFLSHQRKHQQRTVVCIHNALCCDPWFINKIAELLDDEPRQRYGLFVILTGGQELKTALRRGSLQSLAAVAGSHIAVAPLAPAASNKFVLRNVLPAYSDEKDDSFSYASTVVCSLGMASDTPQGSAGSAIPAVARTHNVDRLIVRLGNTPVAEYPIESQCVSIGRDSANDLCIPCLSVSRHHVLIVTARQGVKLVDLGSTNGSTINGERVNSHLLTNGDQIMLGSCQVEFVEAGCRSSEM